MQNNDALTVPFFKTIAVQDEKASKAAGRPIFKETEVVEVRIAGDRNYTPVFPAHQMWMRQGGEEVTYAQRWPDAYARFQAGKEQVADGTPLSELPFLTEAKRMELRGLKVYTAEALASLEGKQLAALGTLGRELKTQATAYLDSAGSTAGTVAMAAELAALRAEVAALRGTDEADPAGDEKEALKAHIASITGHRPKGNPSIETLRDMAAELKQDA